MTAARGNAAGSRQRMYATARVRHHEPQPVRPHEHAIERRPLGHAADGIDAREGPLQAQRRQLAQADDPVDVDRVVDMYASGLDLLVVVRGLVCRDVRPHLQAAHGDVARTRPRQRHAQSNRAGKRDRLRQDGVRSQPLSGDRRRNARRDDSPGGRSNRLRQPHWAVSICSREVGSWSRGPLPRPRSRRLRRRRSQLRRHRASRRRDR